MPFRLTRMQTNEDSTSPQRRTSQLPPLAPRQSNSSSRDRSSGSGSGSRPPRLSHRSRQGCWTCRARKVKCDEVHPKCGPCTRLNRECDWDHRWNFSDATKATRDKYPNVKADDNVVWDPEARPLPNHLNHIAIPHDDQLDFHLLGTDEERERKAETRLPGTYGVVVTPESFADLPEYATASAVSSRRLSLQSHMSGISFPTPPFGRSVSRASTDPNVVVLDRFEDTIPSSASAFLLPSPARRPSLPETQHFSIATTPLVDSFRESSTAFPPNRKDDNLITHFRHYVVSRLIQPQIDAIDTDIISPGSTRDTFETVAARFPPLHHAICAISALNLAYSGRSTMEEALQHYHQALSLTNASVSDDLSSGGVFLRHFLLLIFDICFQISDESGSANAWTIHLNNLQRSAILRYQRHGREPHAFLIWCICELDMYACLLGNGNCDFLRTIIQQDMLPPLDQQVPTISRSISNAYFQDDPSNFQDILALRQTIVIQTANIARTAQAFRSEALELGTVPASTNARWQASVSHLQSDLVTNWMQWCPHYLNAADPTSGGELPEQSRAVYEHALTLYHAAMIYTRTSMFPGQRRLPIANQVEMHADTETRVFSIIARAAAQLELGYLNRRHIVFPLFMAGFAASQPDTKVQALDLMKSLEGFGVGQNTSRTRQLLKAVYEEQRRKAEEGGRMEDVDWLALAKARSLTVVNCGL